MADKDEELGEIQFSPPEPLFLTDGDIVLLDPECFATEMNAIAAQSRDGGLYVLDKMTKKWRNVEDACRRPDLTSIKRIK